MRVPKFILACILLMPTVALAQSPDIGDASTPSLSETDESISAAPPDVKDLEGRIGSKSPATVQPQFDMTAEQPDYFDSATGLDQTDPEPAPGLTIKIPTN